MKKYLYLFGMCSIICFMLWGCKTSSNNETTTKEFNDKDYYITTVEKNVNDVKKLKNIIKELRSKGAKVSENIDVDKQYGWDIKTGRLTYISWIDKDIKGELNLSKLDALTSINCSKNDITHIEVSGLSDLYELECSHNKIKKLDLEGLIELGVLECSYNEIEEINLDDLDNLIQFNCSNNKLRKLDISNTEILEFGMDCSDNDLIELKLGDGCLRYLDCSNNELTYLDVSGLYEATELYCQNNNLEYLKIVSLEGSANNLITINCKNNKLTRLTISGLSNLETLKCDDTVDVIK